ncbi:hypothetical protein D3C87_1514310 [compost metagenome]
MAAADNAGHRARRTRKLADFGRNFVADGTRFGIGLLQRKRGHPVACLGDHEEVRDDEQ